jgi:hypothetical protein
MVVCGLFAERPEEEVEGSEDCIVAAGTDTWRDAATVDEPIPDNLIDVALRDEVVWVADTLKGPSSECEEVATPVPARAGLVEDTTS